MIWNLLFVAVLSPLAALAAPHRLVRRDMDDIGMLRFLNVMEEFDKALYTQILAKFSEHDFTEAGFSSMHVPKTIMQKILADDTAHASFLADGLRGAALRGCKFNFDPILTDVKSAMGAARVFEEVTVAAYTGTGLLLEDANFRFATSSIVTNEAKHQSFMNVLNGGSDVPQSFGVSLRPEQALSVLSPFISGCDLEMPVIKPLKLTSRLQAGASIYFDRTNLPNDNQLFCHILVGGQPQALSQPMESCSLPVDTLEGPVYIFITDDAHPLASNILSQNYESIQAGPAVAFVDKREAVLGKLVLHDGLHGHHDSSLDDVKVLGVHHLQRVQSKGNKLKQ